MSQAASKPLIDVLREARAYLERQTRHPSWRYWKLPEDAVRALDAAIAKLERDGMAPRVELDVLFAPTGPIEQVSLLSGWGREFVDLAARFDAAMEDLFSGSASPA